MRIATIYNNGAPTVAIRRDDDYVDLSMAAPNLPQDVRSLLESELLEEAAEAASNSSTTNLISKNTISYCPPISDPRKILCCGLNYRDHAEEVGAKIPDYPIIFTRFCTTLAAHNKPMVRPKASIQFDYEAELAVVIGKTGKHLSKDSALDIVAGYSCFNDGSLRDYQFKAPQWTMGKNFDLTGGFGPEIVTADELPLGAEGLNIACRINGETLQDSNTSQPIYDVATVIETITEALTLEPGDIIIMGTPPGVASARDPQPWMKAGDVCEVEIEKIGLLRNTIIDE